MEQLRGDERFHDFVNVLCGKPVGCIAWLDGADAISLSNSLDVSKVNPAGITTICPPDLNPADVAEFFNRAGLFPHSVYGRPLERVRLALRDE
jgi:hypothetical protein